MLDTAIVGLGWWGRKMTELVQARSGRLRFVRAAELSTVAPWATEGRGKWERVRYVRWLVLDDLGMERMDGAGVWAEQLDLLVQSSPNDPAAWQRWRAHECDRRFFGYDDDWRRYRRASGHVGWNLSC